jgi:hypothetical protein
VLETAHSEVQNDWAGLSMPGAFRWSLAQDPERLWVSLELPVRPPSEQKHELGDFVEGLWEADVVELFLMSPSGRYQEWNVSPDGAWWAMSFVGYRQRDSRSTRPEGVVVEVFHDEESWRAVLSVPRSALPEPLTESTRVHVSGIIHRPDGSSSYLSSAGSPAFEPDFHDSRCFKPAAFVQL